MNMASNSVKSEYEQIKDFITLCLKHWYYFVVSMFVCGVIGIVNFTSTAPVYSVVSQVSIRHDESLLGNPISSGSSMLSAFGFGAGSENVEDETLKLSSQGYMKKVVKDLRLNTNYTQTKFLGFSKTALYDKTPLLLDVDEAVSDTIFRRLIFSFKIQPERTSVKVKLGFKTLVNMEINSFPAIIKTPFADFTLSKSQYFDEYNYPMTVTALYGSYDYWTQIYRNSLNIDFEKKTSDIIHLNMETEYIPLAKKLLKGIVETYNEEWDKDKMQVSNRTIQIINDQLYIVENLLFSADEKIQQFKDKHNLTEVEADVSFYLAQSAELQAGLLQAQTQLSLIDVITGFVTDPANKYAPIPFSLSTSDPAFALIISDYNKELIKRNDLFRDGVRTALLNSYDEQLQILHQTMLRSLKNLKEELQISLNTFRKKEKELNQKLGNIPQIERDYIQLRREQELQQGIYVFFLEMRAQATVKGLSLLPKLKIIDTPYVINKPVSPNLMKIALVVLFFGGIIIPFILIFGLPYLKKRKNK